MSLRGTRIGFVLAIFTPRVSSDLSISFFFRYIKRCRFLIQHIRTHKSKDILEKEALKGFQQEINVFFTFPLDTRMMILCCLKRWTFLKTNPTPLSSIKYDPVFTVMHCRILKGNIYELFLFQTFLRFLKTEATVLFLKSYWMTYTILQGCIIEILVMHNPLHTSQMQRLSYPKSPDKVSFI